LEAPIVLPLLGGEREARERAPLHAKVERLQVLTEQADAVAYLTLCGDGTWGYAHPDTKQMVNFVAGVHRVDATTVEFARRAEIPHLIITEEPPLAVRRSLEGPLSPEHIRVPARGVELMEEGEEVYEPDLDLERPLAHACSYCGARFPHAAPLRRHVELHHRRFGDEA